MDQRWRDLAARAQEGDKKSYNALLKELIPYIQSIIAPKLANPDWVDDLTQNILISVHKSLHTYSSDRPFRPWLISIINFRKTDFLRKYYKGRGDKKVSTDDYVFETQHVTEPHMAGEYKDMEGALNALPDNQKKIFTLLKIQGFSTKEVAEKMDMSESAVKVSAHRTQKKLKDHAQKGMDEV